MKFNNYVVFLKYCKQFAVLRDDRRGYRGMHARQLTCKRSRYNRLVSTPALIR